MRRRGVSELIGGYHCLRCFRQFFFVVLFCLFVAALSALFCTALGRSTRSAYERGKLTSGKADQTKRFFFPRLFPVFWFLG